jgi:hypothetical protein
VAAIAMGNPFMTHVVWMGQTSLVSFAAVACAWMFATRDARWCAGFCLGLASFKPQLCVLVFFWFFLEREWKILAAAVGTIPLLAFYPMVKQGPIAVFAQWKAGVQSDYALPFNVPGALHKIGLESLLHSIGLSIPSGVFLALSFLCVVVLWRVRASVPSIERLALLMLITFVFSNHLHDYDYVGLLPGFASLWWMVRRGSVQWYVALGLSGLLFMPQRFVRGANLPVLNHWRTFVIRALTALIILAMARSLRRPKTSAQP